MPSLFSDVGKEYLGLITSCDPICGKDFCDVCGDCLRCYGSDPCNSVGGTSHDWIVYFSHLKEFLELHPSAKVLHDSPI